jgi:hypothetical protein
MNTDGGTKDDVKLPDGKLGEDILAGFEVAETVMVTVTAAMGEEQVRSSCSPLAMFRFLIRVPGHVFQGHQLVNVCNCFDHMLGWQISRSLLSRSFVSDCRTRPVIFLSRRLFLLSVNICACTFHQGIVLNVHQCD